MPGRVLRGPQPSGGVPDVDIRPTPGTPGHPNPAHHPSLPQVEKRSRVRVAGTGFSAGRIKLGLRLHQDDGVGRFTIRDRRGRELRLDPAPQHVAELDAGLGRAAGERWLAYETDWTPQTGVEFATELVLDHHAIPDNGFRVVAVAFTHTDKRFDQDDYIYGVSVIPGRNSRGFRIALGPGATRRARAAPRKTARRRAPAKRGGRRKR